MPHKRFLNKIETYAILSQISIYRRQRVVLKGWQDVKSSVPQVSILVPLLFLIYANDIPESVSSQVVIADNTKLMYYFYIYRS